MPQPDRAGQATGEPLVTIGCAVYNGEATLERALTPLIEQDYGNIEILIADDCSTDSTLTIAEEFARRDPRIRIIRNHENVGLTRNFNRLFAEARGKYFLWADQDDIRDRSFVRKTATVLERRPDAVLCHSYTAGFIGTPDRVVVIATLDGVHDVRPLLRRYWAFLRAYSDTTVYGLLRSDALRTTRLWRDDLGAANALLFELLLRGCFLQVPEVLYQYSGRGPRNRPTPAQEYARQNKGKGMPRWYLPFVVLAVNQTKGIWASNAGMSARILLTAVVWWHLLLVNGAKLVFRIVDWIMRGDVPDWLTRVCEAAVMRKSHLRFVGGADRDRSLFPKAWLLRGRT